MSKSNPAEIVPFRPKALRDHLRGYLKTLTPAARALVLSHPTNTVLRLRSTGRLCMVIGYRTDPEPALLVAVPALLNPATVEGMLVGDFKLETTPDNVEHLERAELDTPEMQARITAYAKEIAFGDGVKGNVRTEGEASA